MRLFELNSDLWRDYINDLASLIEKKKAGAILEGVCASDPKAIKLIVTVIARKKPNCGNPRR